MGQEQKRNTRGLAVIIPAFNAADTIGPVLGAVGSVNDVVVVDGGSTDATADVARAAGARVIPARRGRGRQMAAGVAAAQGEWLLLLHADTCLTSGWRDDAARFMAADAGKAGYFRLRLDSADVRARRVERLAAWRARMLGLPYGDQGLLLRRDLLAAVGGVRELPLMEDVDLVRRLGRARLAALDAGALTSARRYEQDGWISRPVRNLCCLAMWFLGVPAALIERAYG
jgi:rSAM/selenodomain-associated transferase 2